MNNVDCTRKIKQCQQQCLNDPCLHSEVKSPTFCCSNSICTDDVHATSTEVVALQKKHRFSNDVNVLLVTIHATTTDPHQNNDNPLQQNVVEVTSSSCTTIVTITCLQSNTMPIRTN